MQEPDFLFNLSLPVNLPTEDEVELIGNHLDGYVKQLVEDKYITLEEGVVYTKFISQAASLMPFLLDDFIERYRKSKWNQEVQEEAKRKASIVKPTDEDIEKLR